MIDKNGTIIIARNEKMGQNVGINAQDASDKDANGHDTQYYSLDLNKDVLPNREKKSEKNGRI